ncbi:MAG TPA: hypothetical protein VLA49_13200 [Anaerolineales bacterium]|nr:hypothetical protein [Anaerolineales bacterium]
MSKALRISLIIVGIVVISAALLWAGILIGRSSWSTAGFWPVGMMGYRPGSAPLPNAAQVPNGMMAGGMMGRYGGRGRQADTQFGYGMMGPGMMSGYAGAGMMGAYASGGLAAVEPLSIEQAQQALEAYLNSLNDADLELKEIMIFKNHAYAEIVEKSTGVGAMELLVDPATLAVYPEHGPNMMWNLKYGMMSGSGGHGMLGRGMMGAWGQNFGGTAEISAEMPVSSDQAVEAAQGYLDRNYPGKQVDDHADVFYGYYTLHILQDGQVVGMLSVNGYSGQVFPHTWHGDFIEMSEEE